MIIKIILEAISKSVSKSKKNNVKLFVVKTFLRSFSQHQ